MWDVLEWAAWVVSALLFGWMVHDAYAVGREYSEDILLSSREGLDELFSGPKESER
ncbi:MAG: hypothetical protein IRY94_00755 [Rhodospirillaceae bacterium]|nr:hypothetical protein [Rhodospirillaceae bacterium]